LPYIVRDDTRLLYVPLIRVARSRYLLRDRLEVDGRAVAGIGDSENAALDYGMAYSLLTRLVGPEVASQVREMVARVIWHPDAVPWSSVDELIQHGLRQSDAPHEASATAAYHLIRSLQDSRVMWLPLTGAIGERHIVRFSYDTVFAQRRPRSVLRVLVDSLAWTPANVYFDLSSSLGPVETYEVEIAAPPGLSITDAELYSFVSDRSTAAGEVERPTVQLQSLGEFAQLRAEGITGRGLLRLGLLPARSGFLSAAWIIACGVAVLLTGFWRWSYTIASDPTAAVAILILVPAILSALLLRPVEAPDQADRVLAIRLLLLLSAALPVFAAVAIVHSEHQLALTRSYLRTSSYISYAIVAVLSVSAATAIFQRRRTLVSPSAPTELPSKSEVGAQP
jgi:fumarate reductase subunit D